MRFARSVRLLLCSTLAALGISIPEAGGADVVPASRKANHVAVLTLEGQVDSITLRSLERRVEQAVADGADAIVLDIDTPGGAVVAALDICHLLKTDAPANTVAWINPDAYSAGTIIALACREIVTAPNATFGDAAPIAAPAGMLMSLPAAERAKIEAPILEEVVDSARRRHYDENLVRAFVAVGVELWLIEHNTTGRRVFVDRAEYKIVFDEEPPDIITALSPDPDAVPVTPWVNRAVPLPKPSPDGPSTPATGPSSETSTTPANADDAPPLDSVLLAQTRPPVRDRLTVAERGDWTLITQVVSRDELLTLKPEEARFYGLTQGEIRNDAGLLAYFGAKKLTRYDRSWSESMVRFLTQPIVMGILIVVLLVCGFIEMAAPGLGVFGAVALAALAMLIGAPMLAGMAQWWDVLLIGVGVLLVAAELFIIPGTGIAGVAGAAALLAGIVGLFVSNDLGSSTGQSELIVALLTTLTSFFAAGIGVWLISRQIHSMPFFDRLILKTEVGEQPPAPLLAAMGTQATTGLQVGTVGRAFTDLRPAGRAEFDGRLHDVTTAGMFIVKGTAVRVVRADDFAIEVEGTEE
ncbi:MAG: NfeD family protein [Planctomycetota bacterium]|jgi:membrane-bound serine protease (ClpP class)